MAGLRFSRAAAARMRAAIDEAGGVEVFAIGEVDGIGRVSSLEIHCRGSEAAVPALLERPRAGQVVIHNHPSGVLKASGADFALANRYGDEGIGVQAWVFDLKTRRQEVGNDEVFRIQFARE